MRGRKALAKDETQQTKQKLTKTINMLCLYIFLYLYPSDQKGPWHRLLHQKKRWYTYAYVCLIHQKVSHPKSDRHWQRMKFKKKTLLMVTKPILYLSILTSCNYIDWLPQFGKAVAKDERPKDTRKHSKKHFVSLFSLYDIFSPHFKTFPSTGRTSRFL